MSEPANRTSILCPLCGERSTKHVCAHCALTTAEERDAARAEVARLTTIVDLVAAIKAEHDQAALGWSGKESDRHWGDLFDALDAYRAATIGGSDAAT